MAARKSFSTEWTCKDNSTIELTAEQLIGLTVALAEHSSRCHAKALELKSSVNSALTVAEVEAIVWEEQAVEESTPEANQESPSSEPASSVNDILAKGE